MCFLIPIKYGKRTYPNGIDPKIEELAGHFDKKSISPRMDYSLHTEYSVGKRKFETNILNDFPIIKKSHKKLIPQLWVNKEWSHEFSKFIIKLVGNNIPPKIIEIHPPFNDYCNSISAFLVNYEIFENEILKAFPNTEILIENRTGTMYSGGKFLISTNQDIIKLTELLRKLQLRLNVVLDIPQLFTVHRINLIKISKTKIEKTLHPIKKYRDRIAGIHIWGKRKNIKGRLVSHVGDLNSYFNYNQNLKNAFLSEIHEIFNDGKSRYFVPEVNSSNDDLASIINDFKNAGFIFI